MYCPECQEEKETRDIGVCSVCYRELKDRIKELQDFIRRARGICKKCDGKGAVAALENAEGDKG